MESIWPVVIKSATVYSGCYLVGMAFRPMCPLAKA